MERLDRLQSVGQPWNPEPRDGTPEGQGEVLRVTTLYNPYFMGGDWRPDGSFDCRGYLCDLWHMIADHLNITYRIAPLESGDYGTLDANNTWSGMVGQLAYGHADIALAPLVMRADRSAVIDFLDAYPVARMTHGLYVRADQGEHFQMSTMSHALLKPLDVNVWWVLLTSLLLLATALHICLRFSHANTESNQRAEDMTWSSCLLACFMSQVGQGWTTTPNSLAARTVTISCWVLATVLSTSYTANLVSHLTKVTTRPPVSSLKDFSERPDWRFTIPLGHAALNDWKVSSDKYERELYKRTVTGQGFVPLRLTSPDELWSDLQGQTMGYVNIDMVFGLMPEKACSLVPVPDTPAKTYISYMAIAKGRERLRRAINQVLLKMSDSGLIARLKNRRSRPKVAICKTSATHKAIGITDVAVMLLIVPLSLCICVVIFSVEWISFKVQTKKAAEEASPYVAQSAEDRHAFTTGDE